MLLNAISCTQEKELYTIKWRVGGRLPSMQTHGLSLGFAGPATGVHNNVLIVAGGANFPDSMPWMGGKKRYYKRVYLFTRQDKKLLSHKGHFELPTTVAYPASCSTRLGIVYAGGENENGITKKVWMIRWDEKKQTVLVTGLPDLPVALTNAAATVVNDIIYLAGGETGTGVSDDFYSLNLVKGISWDVLPSIPIRVSHTLLLNASNGNEACIYMLGGRKKNANGISDLYSSVYEFNPGKRQWNLKTKMPYSLCAGTGISVEGDKLLLFGGDRGETFHKVEESILKISNEKNDSVRQKLTEQKSMIQATHPGFSRDVLIYNTVTGQWSGIGSIPYDVPATTTAIKWGNQVLIPTGEIRAGVRTPNILLGEISIK